MGQGAGRKILLPILGNNVQGKIMNEENIMTTKKENERVFSVKGFQAFCKKNKIKVQGLNAMPEIGITRALFENPWQKDDEDLYIARGMRLTLAKHPDGTITALNKVSKDYKLVQHYEALQLALEVIIEKYPEFGIPEIDLKYRNSGGRMNAEMRFPYTVNMQGDDDPVKARIILSNSADLSKRFTLFFGAFRLICSNGMVIPDSRFTDVTKIKKLHRLGTLDLDDCIESLTQGFQSFSDAICSWRTYNERTITLGEWEKVMDKTSLSENQVKEVLAIPIIGFQDQTLEGLFANGGQVNAWQAFNAGTQWITHNTTNEQTALDRGVLFSNAFEEMLVKA